jgi:hypothetical protein
VRGAGALERAEESGMSTSVITERRSIPTRHKGIRFRSKLEADWAITFDALGIIWQYEREGRYYGT